MQPDGFQILVKRAQGGNRAAMDEVLALLHSHIEPLARQYASPTKPVESTADLLQESCLRAWNKIGTFEGGSDDEETFHMFRAWIGQIVRRLGMDSRRDQGRRRRKPEGKLLRLDQPRSGESTGGGGGLDVPADVGSPSTIARGNELARRIDGILKGLSDETDAAIVRTYFYDGLTIVDIAKRLDLPYRQVRDRFWKLMDVLKSDLEDWM